MAATMCDLVAQFHSFRKKIRRSATEARDREVGKDIREDHLPSFHFPTDTPQIRTQNLNYRGFHHLRTQVTYMEKNSRRHIGYFSLPGEVRNHIMMYALTPGEVHLYQRAPTDPEDVVPRSGTELVLETYRGAVNRVLKDFRWFAQLPNGIPEFLALQLFTFHPEEYVRCHLTAYAVDVLFPTITEFDWWIRRFTTIQVSWSEIAGFIINSLLDPIVGIPGTQSPIRDTRPAPQILATCKQAYREGHIWFYTHNAIYLPRGSVSLSHHYFKTLQPHHLNLIHTIGIKFGLGDVTEADLDALDLYEKSAARVLSSTIEEDLGLFLGRCCMRAWAAKLVLVRSLSTLHLCRLQSSHKQVDLDGTNLQTSLKGITVLDASTLLEQHDHLGYRCSSRVRGVVMDAFGDVCLGVSRRITRFGWGATRKWLRRGTGGLFEEGA